MNALPMNLMVAPPNAVAPAPGQGASPRDGSEPGFAQCLEQAVERDPAPADAAGKAGAKAPDKAAKEPAVTDEAPAPEAADTASRSTASRTARRATAVMSGPGKAEVAPQAAVLPDAADAAQAKAVSATDAGAEDLAAPPPKKEHAPELANLLPGWTPASAPATPSALPAGGTAGQGPVADATLAATAAAAQAAQAALPADAQASAQPLRADESTVPTSFTLPQPAAAAVQATRPTQDSAAPTQAHVAAPVDSPAFAPALATQVRWLVRDGLQHAQLSLNPAEMGPVTVQIVLDGREARIDFRADLALTRNAIESSLPVLAAALDESGLRLAGGGVHDGQTSRQGMGQQGWQGSAPGARAGIASGDAGTLQDGGPAGAARVSAPARGLVDLVA